MDLCVREGTIRTLVGPDGTGKTTLFNLLSGLLKPSALPGAAPHASAAQAERVASP